MKINKEREKEDEEFGKAEEIFVTSGYEERLKVKERKMELVKLTKQ